MRISDVNKKNRNSREYSSMSVYQIVITYRWNMSQRNPLVAQNYFKVNSIFSCTLSKCSLLTCERNLFDQFTHFSYSAGMCRTFYLIALTVATNYVLECSAVPAGVKHRRSHGLLPIAAAQQQQRNFVDPNDVELVDPIETSSTVNMSRATSRNQLFDNIFKVRTH